MCIDDKRLVSQYFENVKLNRRYIDQSSDFLKRFQKNIHELKRLVVVSDTVDLSCVVDGYILVAGQALSCGGGPVDLAIRCSDAPMHRDGFYNIRVVRNMPESIQQYASDDNSSSRRYFVHEGYDSLSLFDRIEEDSKVCLVRSDYMVTSFDELKGQGAAGALFLEEFRSLSELVSES